MKLQVAKWGNSLALRLPVAYVRRAGLKEGDSLQASLTAEDNLNIHPVRWSRKAFAQELVVEHEKMSRGTSVIDTLRQQARY